MDGGMDGCMDGRKYFTCEKTQSGLFRLLHSFFCVCDPCVPSPICNKFVDLHLRRYPIIKTFVRFYYFFNFTSINLLIGSFTQIKLVKFQLIEIGTQQVSLFLIS